ncbi:Rhodanese-like domain protein [Roseivivax sp. THAF40]|uniref:rhodanese-like domain-containing protein n=1 Tax=unclassified Roseivivax TaxID=2639302 RepID=UPI0012A8329B|nr:MULTISPECIES: rhodanese-like domain-containing protein [unclassified Roseivivax]QFS84045.1 Rhodanese-like domain protein [Roseivivax sp. THAF197b]QFT47872.1 Rhodanese-like domain protein [Roseivivax sp. THAF40]
MLKNIMNYAGIFACLGIGAAAQAEEAVNITPELSAVTVETGQGPVEISRIQDVDNVLTGAFARTSRPCPNFCIQPMQAAPGVTTIGELELLEALQDPEVTVIDSRVRPDWETGTIPGSISMPYTEMADRLHELGCEPDFEGYECGPDVGEIVLFCNGPWCGQSPTAIGRIIEAGFPAEKISYYRWGMQGWRLLGLTVAGGS